MLDDADRLLLEALHSECEDGDVVLLVPALHVTQPAAGAMPTAAGRLASPSPGHLPAPPRPGRTA